MYREKANSTCIELEKANSIGRYEQYREKANCIVRKPTVHACIGKRPKL